MYMRARALESMNRFEEAKETLRQLLAAYPDDRMAHDAKTLLDRLRARDGELEASDPGRESEP